MKGDKILLHSSDIVPYYHVTSDEDAAVSSDQETFDGKVINDVQDGTSNDWQVVNTNRTSMRKLALCRTASAPIKIPNTNRSIKKQNVFKTFSSSPSSDHKKIVYGRDELLGFRYSPLSMTPPSNLEEILEATKPAKRRQKKKSIRKSPENGLEGQSTAADSGNEGATVMQSDSDDFVTHSGVEQENVDSA